LLHWVLQQTPVVIPFAIAQVPLWHWASREQALPSASFAGHWEPVPPSPPLWHQNRT
jgi:hypothetical protein